MTTRRASLLVGFLWLIASMSVVQVLVRYLVRYRLGHH
jgi:hypothetical protein